MADRACDSPTVCTENGLASRFEAKFFLPLRFRNERSAPDPLTRYGFRPVDQIVTAQLSMGTKTKEILTHDPNLLPNDSSPDPIGKLSLVQFAIA